LVKGAYVPAAHALAVADEVRAGQKWPAAHTPEATVAPVLPTQKKPAGHGVHSSALVRRDRLLNVPGGHEFWFGNDVPAGQK
jgi:hypothetical protein